jgi:hypothetical protein
MAHRLGSRLALWAAMMMAGVPVEASEPPPKKPVELPPLNGKVCDYAREHLGKKVGNGQCTSLAVEALQSAGAARSSYREPNQDYVWGRPIKTFKEALPGDVLQFRDAVFEGKKSLSRTRVMSWHAEYPHHTAIVAEVKENGRAIDVLHQNVGPSGTPVEKMQIVQRDTIRVESLKKGNVWIYRPVPIGELDERP